MFTVYEYVEALVLIDFAELHLHMKVLLVLLLPLYSSIQEGIVGRDQGKGAL